PGPACFGRGGERPTVTDACVALGWLDAASPLADGVRLDPQAAERALRRLGPAVGSDSARIAAGVVAVACAVMARALKRVSVARGLDPRRMTLLPFGGAGALFGCQLADALGMGTIVVPPHPGALSALGLAFAPERPMCSHRFTVPWTASSRGRWPKPSRRSSRRARARSRGAR